MKKFFGKVFNLLFWVFCSLCLTIALNSFIQKEYYGVQQPMIFGYGYATVETGSMEPNIPVGSLIVIKDTDDYQKGDVITYTDYRNLSITHRVMSNEDGVIVAKGDANTIADPEFTEDAVIGEVILSVPKVGSFLRKISSPVIIAILVVMLVMCIFWDSISGLFKNRKTKRSIEEDKVIDADIVDPGNEEDPGDGGFGDGNGAMDAEYESAEK